MNVSNTSSALTNMSFRQLIATLLISAAFLATPIGGVIVVVAYEANSLWGDHRTPEERRVDKEKAKEDRLQQMANIAISQILHVKDPRTNICFAFTWAGGLQGVQALTQVPENKIPPELLKTGKVERANSQKGD